MNSDTDRWLRIVRTFLSAFPEAALDQALEHVPAAMRADVASAWERERAVPIRRAAVLSGARGPKPWTSTWRPQDGYYWPRLRNYLIDVKHRPITAVDSLDEASNQVLFNLEDPRPTGPTSFRTVGLVVGYVQSGKTANYSALIAKAADLGYKLVIVLSGIHNLLRRQTQLRLEKELGVGGTAAVQRPEHGRRWITLTTSELSGDFDPGTIHRNVLQGNDCVLLVVKKNKAVLERLVDWLGDPGEVPPQLPVLIVDDEADQASVNTGGNRPGLQAGSPQGPQDDDDDDGSEEEKPSVINGLIRRLVDRFHRVAVVSYTATPFANIFIDHEATDRVAGEDLYPRDFMVSLDYPDGYVGAEHLFGREALTGEPEGVEGLNVIETVPEIEIRDLVPGRGEAETFEPEMTASLRQALRDYLLSSAAVRERMGDGPSSMLIHTHTRTGIQQKVFRLVDQEWAYIRQAWRYERAAIRPQLERRWNQAYRPTIVSIDATRDRPFEAIEPHIDAFLAAGPRVLTINSASDDQLDYEREPNLKAILVGGNRLSRGLTLEGLVVSYFVRESHFFDTLLQMGRWFGFRRDYADLTRLWTSQTLSGWFRDLARTEEELRREIRLYAALNRSPLDFGPRIRAHADMDITAKNKMGAGHMVQPDYLGRLVQTVNFKLDDSGWLLSNLAATQAFLGRLGPPDRGGVSQPTWQRVAWREVYDFLGEYRVSGDGRLDGERLRDFVRICGEVDRGIPTWIVSVRGQPALNPDLGTIELGGPRLPGIPAISRSRLRDDPTSIGSLINPAVRGANRGDELEGMSAQQIQAAEDFTTANGAVTYSDALRASRDPSVGLLLLYPISKHSKARAGAANRRDLFDFPDRHGEAVVGMAAVFPRLGTGQDIYAGSVAPITGFVR